MVEFVMGPEPWFAQEANYIPPRLSDSSVQKCKAMLHKIVDALGFDNCGFHCEMRLTDKGPVLIEIAARLPGGPLQPGYKRAYGADLSSLLVDIWLSEDISLDKFPTSYIVQKAVFSTKTRQSEKHYWVGQNSFHARSMDFAEILKKGDTVNYYPDIPTPFYYYAA